MYVPLDPLGENQLLELAADRLVRRQKALTRELLRDRAAALRGAPVPDVGHRRGADADEIEAVVIVEPLILDGDERLDEMRGNFGERHVDPLFLEDGEGELILGVEDRRRLIHVAHLRDGVADREAPCASRDRPDRADDRQHDRQRESEGDADGDARVLASGAEPLVLQLIQTVPKIQ